MHLEDAGRGANRMSGVATAVGTDDDVGVHCQSVCQFPLALISPLSTHNDCRRHIQVLAQARKTNRFASRSSMSEKFMYRQTITEPQRDILNEAYNGYREQRLSDFAAA